MREKRGVNENVDCFVREKSTFGPTNIFFHCQCLARRMKSRKDGWSGNDKECEWIEMRVTILHFVWYEWWKSKIRDEYYFQNHLIIFWVNYPNGHWKVFEVLKWPLISEFTTIATFVIFYPFWFFLLIVKIIFVIYSSLFK